MLDFPASVALYAPMNKSFLPWSVGLLLLLLAIPASGQTAEEIERVFWQSVECKSRLQVQAYLQEFPEGRYLAEAWSCLEGQLGLDRAARRLVQQGLTALDYAVGAADGLFGPATRKALRDWQAGKGFAATGYLTREQADTLMAQGREAVAEQRQQEEAHRQAEAQREQEETRQRSHVTTAQTQESSSRLRSDQTCARQSKGTECWMELANQAGCYVWNGNLQEDETVTWTGECSSGFAHGKGTLVWASNGNKEVVTGPRQGGKLHGHVVIYDEDGDVLEGPYVDGKRHGQWIERQADGDILEGSYADGKPHGQWVIRKADGAVWEGPVADGKRHGQWVERQADGTIEEGPIVDNKRYGRWVIRDANGTVEEGFYVDGKRRGHWTVRWADGTTEEGPIVDGERHGRWTIREMNGAVSEVTYVHGERQYQ